MSDVEQEAAKLRSEAYRHLNALLKIPEGHGNGTVERFVDCVISAAMLEVMVVVQEAARGPQTK